MDKDTQAELLKQERVHDFVNSDAWRYVKEELLNHVKLFDSISTMNFSKLTPEQIALEAQSRANTVVTIMDWITRVEGIASTFNREVIQTPTENYFINLEE